MPSNETSDLPQGYSWATAQPTLTQHHITKGCQLLYTLKESHSLNPAHRVSVLCWAQRWGIRIEQGRRKVYSRKHILTPPGPRSKVTRMSSTSGLSLSLTAINGLVKFTPQTIKLDSWISAYCLGLVLKEKLRIQLKICEKHPSSPINQSIIIMMLFTVSSFLDLLIRTQEVSF